MSKSCQKKRFMEINYNNFHWLFVGFHYVNMPMQYAAIFHGSKNNNFQRKNCDSFLIFPQNIDCGYMLEVPH